MSYKAWDMYMKQYVHRCKLHKDSMNVRIICLRDVSKQNKIKFISMV